MSTATARRLHARTSLRENRVQPTRRKPRSRSPDSRPASVNSMNAPIASSSGNTNVVRKRKKVPHSSLTAPTISSANHSRHGQNQQYNNIDDEQSFQPQSLRRGRSKTKSSGSRQNIDFGIERGRAALSSIGKKENHRSRSREQTRTHKRPASPDAIEADDESSGGYTGPLAFVEFNRLKAEVEKLKEQLLYSKKTIHKQSKVIDELRQEVNTINKFSKEQVAHVEKLKNKFKKSEELLGNIEGSLQCQICLDTLLKPYTLSPCGHVLCQGCLQKWFRTPPVNEDDMQDDEGPASLVYRRKSCPCCRTVVRARPIPLFIVKSIAAAFDQAKSPTSSRRPSPPPDPDPWVGIFPDQDENMSSEDDDDDDDDDDNDDGWDYDIMPGYGSDSDEEAYEGDYVPTRWQPPSVPIDPQDFSYDDLNEDDFKMLRRGATVQMIELFNMQYSHSEGLSAIVDDGNRVYLGWNINLHPSDFAGEDFIDYIVNDIFERGERWDLEEDEDGSWIAWKLLPADEEEGFNTTDSEAWEAYDDAGGGSE